MSTSIYVGTRGWDDPAWAARFYPEELPGDWRFCYYSNRLRSVIVPGDAWPAAGPDAVAQWIEDSDPDFGFVLELPLALCRPTPDARALDTFIARTTPLKAQRVGWLVRPDAATQPDADWLASVIERLAVTAPVCVDLADRWRGPEIERYRIALGAGRCWRPLTEPVPAPEGLLLICLAQAGTPRAQRQLLEDINKWQAGQRLAGLFFEGTNAAAQADQARLLAELMGV